MGKIQFGIISAVVALFAIVASAEGLKCYECLHIDTKLPSGYQIPLPSEKSCKKGKTPDKKFLVDCSLRSYTRSSSTFGTSLTVGNALVHEQTVSPQYAFNSTNVTYTCGKMSVDGKFHDGMDFEGIIRTCIMSRRNSSFAQECNKGTLYEVATKVRDNEMKEYLQRTFSYLNSTRTKASVCTCNKDSCNGASVISLQSMWALLGVTMAGIWLASR